MADRPQLKVIAGGTDVLIKIQEHPDDQLELLGLSRITALKGVLQMPDGRVVIGPLTSFTEISP